MAKLYILDLRGSEVAMFRMENIVRIAGKSCCWNRLLVSLWRKDLEIAPFEVFNIMAIDLPGLSMQNLVKTANLRRKAFKNSKHMQLK